MPVRVVPESKSRIGHTRQVSGRCDRVPEACIRAVQPTLSVFTLAEQSMTTGREKGALAQEIVTLIEEELLLIAGAHPLVDPGSLLGDNRRRRVDQVPEASEERRKN